MGKGSIGVNTGTIIDIRKQRNAWMKKKGTVKCKDCSFFQFGYYCSKKKRTPPYYMKPRVCGSFRKLK